MFFVKKKKNYTSHKNVISPMTQRLVKDLFDTSPLSRPADRPSKEAIGQCRMCFNPLTLQTYCRDCLLVIKCAECKKIILKMNSIHCEGCNQLFCLTCFCAYRITDCCVLKCFTCKCLESTCAQKRELQAQDRPTKRFKTQAGCFFSFLFSFSH
jgi:hypothetical protein